MLKSVLRGDTFIAVSRQHQHCQTDVVKSKCGVNLFVYNRKDTKSFLHKIRGKGRTERRTLEWQDGHRPGYENTSDEKPLVRK